MWPKYFHTCSFTERGASLTGQQIFLYGTAHLSLYILSSLYFSSFSPVLLSYLFLLAPALSHSTQTFHPVGPYLLLYLALRPCCPTIASPSLSGCCPHCNCDRRAGSLSVIAHWSNTCQSADPMWGSHCVFVCLKYMCACEHLWKTSKKKISLWSPPRHVPCLLLHAY